MADQMWHEGTLWEEKGAFALARVRYTLLSEVEPDGFVRLAGRFAMVEELSPVHTGMAQLAGPAGAGWRIRILRLSRPSGDGELEVVSGLPRAPEVSRG